MDKHIRKIFGAMVVVMIVLFVMALRGNYWSNINWLMLSGAVVCGVLVLRVFVYIFNFSYGLVCVLNGALLAIWFANPPAILLGGAMVIYGVRLFLFTLSRMRSPSYAPRVRNVQEADANLPAPIRYAIWVQCSFLYCFHLFAIYFAGSVGTITSGVLAATAIILAGTVIEGLADAQKQNAKSVAPDDFITTGLYSRWRHPNYSGEILVQIGLIVAGVDAVSALSVGSGWANYLAVSVAPVYIILLMISECGRADRYMQLRYGDREDFKAYAARSGSMLPALS